MTERTWARGVYAARAFDHAPDSGPHPRHITEAEECRHAIRQWQPAAVSALEWGAPVRTGTPRAGDPGYEPGEAVTQTVQAARTKLIIAVLLVCVVVLAGLVYAGLRWRMGATWQ